jgi:hypothetical protein
MPAQLHEIQINTHSACCNGQASVKIHGVKLPEILVREPLFGSFWLSRVSESLRVCLS